MIGFLFYSPFVYCKRKAHKHASPTRRCCAVISGAPHVGFQSEFKRSSVKAQRPNAHTTHTYNIWTQSHCIQRLFRCAEIEKHCVVVLLLTRLTVYARMKINMLWYLWAHVLWRTIFCDLNIIKLLVFLLCLVGVDIFMFLWNR